MHIYFYGEPGRKQFKTMILGMLIILSAGLYANTVNMAPVISYLLSETSNSSQALTFVNNTSFPIPDGSNQGPGIVTSEINVKNATISITKVTINLDITHYYIFDLEIRLISPLGTSIRLSSPPLYSCCNGQHYTDTTFDDSAITSISDVAPPFTGTYSPWEPLVELAMEDANGIWKLQIDDYVFVHTGTLNSWSITIE